MQETIYNARTEMRQSFQINDLKAQDYAWFFNNTWKPAWNIPGEVSVSVLRRSLLMSEAEDNLKLS